MEYKNDKLSARLVVPDKLTVRQQLAYHSRSSYALPEERLIEQWYAARELISEWSCPAFPDMTANLNSLDNPEVTDVIIWATLRVKRHISNLDNIPKNS